MRRSAGICRRYLFVAIDRATRWVFVRIHPAKTAANARRFLRDLERAAPMRITRVLTDNGKEFTDRLFGLRRRAATGNHEFDRLCAEFGIEHRLARPMRPQTNGMVERFNGRIGDALRSHRFRSGEDLERTILRYVRLYNGQPPAFRIGAQRGFGTWCGAVPSGRLPRMDRVTGPARPRATFGPTRREQREVCCRRGQDRITSDFDGAVS